MRVDEILDYINHDYKIAIRFNEQVEVKTVWEFLGCYGGEEDFHVEEIEPNGYKDQNGISYLLLHAYDITTVQQSDDELPFR